MLGLNRQYFVATSDQSPLALPSPDIWLSQTNSHYALPNPMSSQLSGIVDWICALGQQKLQCFRNPKKVWRLPDSANTVKENTNQPNLNWHLWFSTAVRLQELPVVKSSGDVSGMGALAFSWDGLWGPEIASLTFNQWLHPSLPLLWASYFLLPLSLVRHQWTCNSLFSILQPC